MTANPIAAEIDAMVEFEPYDGPLPFSHYCGRSWGHAVARGERCRVAALQGRRHLAQGPGRRYPRHRAGQVQHRAARATDARPRRGLTLPATTTWGVLRAAHFRCASSEERRPGHRDPRRTAAPIATGATRSRRAGAPASDARGSTGAGWQRVPHRRHWMQSCYQSCSGGGAGGGGRTHKTLKGRGILSPLRLPVPPRPQISSSKRLPIPPRPHCLLPSTNRDLRRKLGGGLAWPVHPGTWIALDGLTG